MARLPNNKRRLLFVAQRALGLGDEAFRDELENYGGTRHTGDLDESGFAALMDRFKTLGFQSAARRRNFGDREGMASAGQIAKIRLLWSEAADEPTDRTLDQFLEKRFGVSSIRFLIFGRAPHVITALTNMSRRRAAKAAQEASANAKGD